MLLGSACIVSSIIVENSKLCGDYPIEPQFDKNLPRDWNSRVGVSTYYNYGPKVISDFQEDDLRAALIVHCR